jgi:saccharopine dehydrogenase-like NADP-dependent oxidoreductase
MQNYMESWSKKQLEKYSEKSLEQDKKLAEVLVQVKKLLEEMQKYEQQVGKKIEAITSVTWDKGEELQQAIARASMKTERRAWLKRTAISVTASLLAAVLSTLLCIWLLT